MTSDQIIEQAITLQAGIRPKIGAAVAVRGESLCRELLRYDGDTAIVDIEGVEVRWPANEIFDVNRVKNDSIKIKFGLK